MNLKKFAHLQEEAQKEQRLLDRELGALEQLNKQLKEEFDVTLESAEELERELDKEVKQLEEEFDTKLRKLEKKWEDKV